MLLRVPRRLRLVAAIRNEARSIEAGGGPAVAVTGITALIIDVSQKLGDALVPYLLVVVGLAFILLLVVFRSILVPLTATLGFVLTVAATFGVLVAVFQWGWFGELIGVDEPAPIISMLPIFLIGACSGTPWPTSTSTSRGCRGARHGLGARAAVVAGFGHGGRSWPPRRSS